MPLVMGQSRVPDPPARMIPRMSVSLLGVELRVEGGVEAAGVVPGGEEPGEPRLGEPGRIRVLGRQQQLVGRNRELETDLRVERVDPVLAVGL